jgi:transcriptional regulator with XRE-family HTH domain
MKPTIQERNLRVDGQLIKAKRKELKLSQTELGLKLGITKEGISKMEIMGYASNSTRILLNQILGINLPLRINKTPISGIRKEALKAAYKICLAVNDPDLVHYTQTFISWYKNQLGKDKHKKDE